MSYFRQISEVSEFFQQNWLKLTENENFQELVSNYIRYNIQYQLAKNKADKLKYVLEQQGLARLGNIKKERLYIRDNDNYDPGCGGWCSTYSVIQWEGAVSCLVKALRGQYHFFSSNKKKAQQKLQTVRCAIYTKMYTQLKTEFELQYRPLATRRRLTNSDKKAVHLFLEKTLFTVQKGHQIV